MVTRTPSALSSFLITTKEAQRPWEALFRKRVCALCRCFECDWCPNEPELPDEVGSAKPCVFRHDEEKTAHWWLLQETESTAKARELMIELGGLAVKRELQAKDEETTAMLRAAVGTIGGLLQELDEVR